MDSEAQSVAQLVAEETLAYPSSTGSLEFIDISHRQVNRRSCICDCVGAGSLKLEVDIDVIEYHKTNMLVSFPNSPKV